MEEPEPAHVGVTNEPRSLTVALWMLWRVEMLLGHVTRDAEDLVHDLRPGFATTSPHVMPLTLPWQVPRPLTVTWTSAKGPSGVS